MSVGTCGTCRYWSGPADYNTVCLRHPPVVRTNDGQSTWPKVEKGHGCGEHQLPLGPMFKVIRIEGDNQWHICFATGETMMTTDVPTLAESVCANLNRAVMRFM